MQKLKVFLETHKKVKKYGLLLLGAAGLLAAYRFGENVKEFNMSVGNKALHELGYIKYFDPKQNGVEICIEDACKALTRDKEEIKKYANEILK